MSEGIIFNVQKFSTEDGPGIRTTVFFKACTMRCIWCHNPESLHPKPELVWHDARCIADHACLVACPRKSLSAGDDGIRIDRTICEACGTCCEVCPTGALEIIGRKFSADELLEEICKDQVFYETSGGGVTLSGGEPLAQPDLVLSLASRCKSSGLHVALDSCGNVPWERFDRVLPFVDLVLFDLKIMDPEKHRAATGVDNTRALDNVRALAARGVPLWIRTPLIPGYTSDDDNLRAIGAFIREELATVQRWELLAYTNFGLPKYRRLGIPYLLESTPLMTQAQLEHAVDVARPFALDVRGVGETKTRSEASP